MGDLTAAWKRVIELVERGDGYTRREEDDRVVYDWGDDRLRHTLYEPLDEKEAKAFESEVQDLPPSLRELLTAHSNGLDLLSGDVVIRGVGSSDPFADSISFIEDHESGEVTAYVGNAGETEEPLYLEADGRLVLGMHKGATWASLGEFLVEVLEEGLERCWDDEGRRVAELQIGDPPPELKDDVTLSVPSEHADRLDAVRAALKDAPRTADLAEGRYEIVAPDELGDAQVGYRVDAAGEDLTGKKDGDWRPTWIVIGSDEDVGDPLFVDVADEALPVYTAMHGQGDWDPDRVADSLSDALGG